jgi:hypothetical protein
VQEALLVKDPTTTVVEQQAARIGRVEEKIRKAEGLLKVSSDQDESHDARRFYATIFGLPLGIAAFLYLGIFWQADNGTGVYIGIICAVLLWMISKNILALPPSETSGILGQVQRLEHERQRLQEILKERIEAADARTARGL